MRKIFNFTAFSAAMLFAALASARHADVAQAAPRVLQFQAFISAPHRLYVTDPAANTVDIYPAGVVNPKKIGTIAQGVNGPIDVCVDKNGSIYVLNNNPPLVTVYAAGHKFPDRTLVLDEKHAGNIAVGPDGTVYVVTSHHDHYFIEEFDLGAQSPSRVIRIPYEFPYPVTVSSIAIDNETNKLFVNSGSYNSGGGFGISVYLPRRLHPERAFGLTYGYPGGGIEINERNHILIGDSGSVLVAALPRPGTWQFRRIKTPGVSPSFLSLDATSNYLYVVGSGGVSLYDFVNGTPYGSIAGTSGAFGLAVSPPASS